jgi:hypothetical protein
MDCCGGGLDVGVVGSGHAACTSSSAGWCGHPNPGGMWSGHAPSERRVHQNCRPSWREQVCQGSDLLNTRAAVSHRRRNPRPLLGHFPLCAYDGDDLSRLPLHLRKTNLAQLRGRAEVDLRGAVRAGRDRVPTCSRLPAAWGLRAWFPRTASAPTAVADLRTGSRSGTGTSSEMRCRLRQIGPSSSGAIIASWRDLPRRRWPRNGRRCARSMTSSRFTVHTAEAIVAAFQDGETVR